MANVNIQVWGNSLPRIPVVIPIDRNITNAMFYDAIAQQFRIPLQSFTVNMPGVLLTHLERNDDIFSSPDAYLFIKPKDGYQYVFSTFVSRVASEILAKKDPMEHLILHFAVVLFDDPISAKFPHEPFSLRRGEFTAPNLLKTIVDILNRTRSNCFVNYIQLPDGTTLINADDVHTDTDPIPFPPEWEKKDILVYIDKNPIISYIKRTSGAGDVAAASSASMGGRVLRRHSGARASKKGRSASRTARASKKGRSASRATRASRKNSSRSRAARASKKSRSRSRASRANSFSRSQRNGRK